MYKGRERNNGTFSILAITDHPLLREAGVEKEHQILRASTAIHKFAPRDMIVREYTFWMFLEKKFPASLSPSLAMQSILTKKKAWKKTELLN